MGSSESIKMPRKLQILIDRKKRKAVDSYFQAIRNKVGKDTSVVMLYSNDCFPPWSKEEDSASTGSKKAFLDEKCWGAQNKQELPLLPEERSCECDGEQKSARKRYIAGLV